MVYMYTGMPGGGKSLDVAQDIKSKVSRGQNVITNIPVQLPKKKQFQGRLIDLTQLKDIDQLTVELTQFTHRGYETKGVCIIVSDNQICLDGFVDWLMRYAMIFHERGKEGQTLFVIDECQKIWASGLDRISASTQKKWCDFFSEHRQYYFDIILVTQCFRMIARYMRSLVEVESEHRKLNNFAWLRFLPFKWFIVKDFWRAGDGKEKDGNRFFVYRKYMGQMYNSYAAFDRYRKQWEEEEKEKAKKRQEKQEKDNVRGGEAGESLALSSP